MEVQQQEDRQAALEFTNLRPEHRPITIETPVDNGLISTIFMRTNEISLTSLLDENVELYHNINHYRLNLRFFKSLLQIMVATLPL